MRIFLINIKGAGVDLTAGKLTKDQVKNWDKIQANPELIDDNNPWGKLYWSSKDAKRLSDII